MTGFKKATRLQIPLKLALTGPSGSGKTYSALLLARGLVGKKGRIALIDTENRSASLYADLAGEFDTLEVSPPYTVDKYAEGVDAAIEAGYDVLIIDSITHCWAGEGGLLDQKNSLDARGGRQNQYTNWAPITKLHEQFKGKILSSPIHIICTMRSKQDYVLEQNDKGKSAPRKVGMALIQRDGMEYEFTTVFDIAMNHEATASKDRTGLFDGKYFKITGKTGKELLKWLGAAAELPEPTEEDKRKVLDKEWSRAVAKEFRRLGYVKEDEAIPRGLVMAKLTEWAKKPVKALKDLTSDELAAFLGDLEMTPKEMDGGE